MAVSLSIVLENLNRLAPLDQAADWDNVGLLVDPRAKGAEGLQEDYLVENLLLTIDATPEVFAELEALPNALLVAYHPPLFRPVDRISVAANELLFLALRCGVPVYSPHTALDCVPGGVNDWLARGLGPGRVEAVEGRRVTLDEPVALEILVQRMKAHLGVTSMRLATTQRHQKPSEPGALAPKIETVVVAAGSGASCFEQGPRADLYITGECGHHTILSCLREGSSVLLAEHSSSERGYLKVYRERILEALRRQLNVALASADVEPLQVV